MKPILLSALLLLLALNGFAQQMQNDYFLGKNLICPPADAKDEEMLKLGIDCFQFEKYHPTATKIFTDLIKKDSTFCDAWFFAGYSLRIQGMVKEASVFYYMADSLSNNKSEVFKQNLATTLFMAGATKVARKKFTEMVRYFPQNPEGYYGIALTSLDIKDFENGLDCINKAIGKYTYNNQGAFYMKALLLTLTGQYSDGLHFLEKCKSQFKKDDNYNAAMAVCLYRTGGEKNDEKILKAADKAKAKVKEKDKVLPELLALLPN